MPDSIFKVVTQIVMQVSVGLLSVGSTPSLSPTECEGNS